MSTPDAITAIEFRGQPALRLATSGGAVAVVSLHGGQVLSWTPPDGAERLFLSEQAHFDGSAAIRGGVPVCWPQFAEQGRLPRHGLLRTRSWEFVDQRARDGFALVTLRATDDDHSWSIWPHGFSAELTVLIEQNRLAMELEIENTGHAGFVFTGALHTYLRTEEVEQARLQGLSGREYIDAADDNKTALDEAEHLTVSGEVDRIYRKLDNPLVLQEPSRALAIQAQGFPDVVVWNPWQQGCAQLPDTDEQDFRHMLCVEAAIARAPVELAAGETWFGRQTLVTID